MSAWADFEIAELDRTLAADGEDIELRRLIGTQLIAIKCQCRASVRAYLVTELIGGIGQTDSKVVISPTQIIREGWPGPNSSATPTNQDRRVPRKGDKVIIAGKQRDIETALPIYINGQLVRIDMRVLG